MQATHLNNRKKDKGANIFPHGSHVVINLNTSSSVSSAALERGGKARGGHEGQLYRYF